MLQGFFCTLEPKTAEKLLARRHPAPFDGAQGKRRAESALFVFRKKQQENNNEWKVDQAKAE